MDPVGYWLLGVATISILIVVGRLVIWAAQPWIATEKGETIMENISSACEAGFSWCGTMLAISVPVGAVYACYLLGRDLWDKL